MSVTVDYVILPHLKKEDGTNFIRLRITHKRKSKYIKTNITIEPEDLTRSGNLKHQGKKDLADDEVKKWRTAINELTTYALAEMNVGEVVEKIKAKLTEMEGFRLDFIEYGMQLAEKMKPASGHNYRVALRCLLRYFGHHPDISEITVKAMNGFEEFIKNENRQVYHRGKKILYEKKDQPKGGRAISMYLGAVRTIYRRARQQFNEPDRGVFPIPVDTFEYYKVQRRSSSKHRDIPLEWLQLMIDQRKGLRGRQRLAIDTFLISFGLMGMNSVDMFLSMEKPKNDILHYFRTKTTDVRDDNAEMFVRIEPCIKEIATEYFDRVRAFDFYKRYVSPFGLNCAINKGLKSWIDNNKLKHFTFYAARHTWGTVAGSKDVALDYRVITQGMCHAADSLQVDNIYVRPDWERVWEANAKVLAQLKW